jgi:hypothetical protein
MLLKGLGGTVTGSPRNWLQALPRPDWAFMTEIAEDLDRLVSHTVGKYPSVHADREREDRRDHK